MASGYSRSPGAFLKGNIAFNFRSNSVPVKPDMNLIKAINNYTPETIADSTIDDLRENDFAYSFIIFDEDAIDINDDDIEAQIIEVGPEETVIEEQSTNRPATLPSVENANDIPEGVADISSIRQK